MLLEEYDNSDMPLIKLSKPLRNACQTSEYYRILAPLGDCGAFDGGCLVTAHALHTLLPSSTIMAIQGWSPWLGPNFTTEPSAHHALVQLGCLYLDGSGV